MNQIDFDIFIKELTNSTANNDDVNAFQNLSFLATIDPLTRVYNYIFFKNQLGQQWKIAARQNNCIALFKVTINDFQSFCLTRDNRTKDYVLQKIAKCLKLLFRRGTDFVARDQGDQFVILVLDMDSEKADAYKRTIIERINNLKIAHSEINKFLSVTVQSLVHFPKTEESFEILLKSLYENND
jgi:diguanylate cyclase (GGDEF)-like protein